MNDLCVLFDLKLFFRIFHFGRNCHFHSLRLFGCLSFFLLILEFIFSVVCIFLTALLKIKLRLRMQGFVNLISFFYCVCHFRAIGRVANNGDGGWFS